MVTRSFFFIALGAITLLSPIVSNANDDLALEGELQWLQSEAMVFTASKSVEKASKSAATINVITEQQIRQMGARDIIDVLQTISGLSITRNNMWFREIEVRGFKSTFSEKLVFMLNGHNINNGLLNGGAAIMFDRLSVDNIERVEVIRGPASSLYGANAFLGVVNILTKTNQLKEGATLSVQGGSYAKNQYNVQLAKQVDSLRVAINGNADFSNGYKPYVTQDAFAGGPGTLTPGNADTGRAAYDFDLNVDYGDVTLKGKYTTRKDNANFGALNVLNYPSVLRNTSSFLELGYSHTFFDSVTAKGRVYRDDFKFDNNWQLAPPGSIAGFTQGMLARYGAKNSINGAELSLDIETTDWNRITAGINIEEQKQFSMKHVTNYNPTTGAVLANITDFSGIIDWGTAATRRLWSGYIQDILDVNEELRLVASVRYDSYNDFGKAINPKVGATWEVTPGYSFKLMYGTAFRAPTFAEVYNINTTLFLGNRAIKPERIRTAEATVEAQINEDLHGTLTYFYSKATDIIITQGGIYKNISAIRSRGIELSGKLHLNEGSYVAGNYTYIRASDNQATIPQTVDIAKHRANIMLNWQVSDHYNLHSDVIMKGSSPRSKVDNRGALGGYGIVNMTLIAKSLIPSLPGVELRGSVYNVFNKSYASPASAGTILNDYAMPKVNALMELRMKL